MGRPSVIVRYCFAVVFAFTLISPSGAATGVLAKCESIPTIECEFSAGASAVGAGVFTDCRDDPATDGRDCTFTPCVRVTQTGGECATARVPITVVLPISCASSPEQCVPQPPVECGTPVLDDSPPERIEAGVESADGSACASATADPTIVCTAPERDTCLIAACVAVDTLAEDTAWCSREMTPFCAGAGTGQNAGGSVWLRVDSPSWNGPVCNPAFFVHAGGATHSSDLDDPAAASVGITYCTPVTSISSECRPQRVAIETQLRESCPGSEGRRVTFETPVHTESLELRGCLAERAASRGIDFSRDVPSRRRGPRRRPRAVPRPRHRPRDRRSRPLRGRLRRARHRPFGRVQWAS